jgi:hypothetical protein
LHTRQVLRCWKAAKTPSHTATTTCQEQGDNVSAPGGRAPKAIRALVRGHTIRRGAASSFYNAESLPGNVHRPDAARRLQAQLAAGPAINVADRDTRNRGAVDDGGTFGTDRDLAASCLASTPDVAQSAGWKAVEVLSVGMRSSALCQCDCPLRCVQMPALACSACLIANPALHHDADLPWLSGAAPAIHGHLVGHSISSHKV